MTAAANILSFNVALTQRELDEKREQAEIEAGELFDDATKYQAADFKAATSSAEKLFGHGSRAHEAAIRLAKRSWDNNTAEAKALYHRTVERLMAVGEVGDELDALWTELCQREAVAQAMQAAE